MSVSVSRRAFLAQEYRDAATTIDAAVRTAHPLAPQIVEPTLLVAATAAQAEATRRQTIRGVSRRWFRFSVEMSDTNLLLDTGSVISLTHPRYGLAGGAYFVVFGIQSDAKANVLTLTVWG